VQVKVGTLAGPPSGDGLRTKVRTLVEAWAQELCGDDLKEIDSMLGAEMNEDTRTWLQCEEEESFLKFEISDNIFADLLEDTVRALQSIKRPL